jgi:hypothetical protein
MPGSFALQVTAAGIQPDTLCLSASGLRLPRSAKGALRYPMKKLRKRAKVVGLEIRKVGGKFRLWNVCSGSHLDVKRKKRVKQLLAWIEARKCEPTRR